MERALGFRCTWTARGDLNKSQLEQFFSIFSQDKLEYPIIQEDRRTFCTLAVYLSENLFLIIFKHFVLIFLYLFGN